MDTKTAIFASLAAASLSAAAVPRVEDVRLARNIMHAMEVSYRLVDGPAIVTASFATNGVALPGSAVTSLSGQVNMYVTNAACSFTWDAPRDWPDFRGTNMTVSVTAWPLGAPPPYCAVDVSPGPFARDYPVAFYESEEAVPGGVTNARYKITSILLKRVDRPDGGFLMGSPTWESGRQSNREMQRRVWLTEDYYLGVYEVTQSQWGLVMGSNPSGYVEDDWEVFPLQEASYGDWRGSRAAGIDFPSTGRRVSPDSFLGLLRSRAKLYPFDLPTEAQWEYAARAGIAESFCDGTSYSQATNSEGRTASSLNMETKANFGGLVGNPTAVGSYPPTRWGFYDIHGNVCEWCCDWMVPNSADGRAYMLSVGDEVDPKGPPAAMDSTYSRAGRGGYWNSGDRDAVDLRFARRNGNKDDASYRGFGGRVCAPIAPME